MDALAETLLALAPEAHAVGTPTIAALRAKASPIRWIDAPPSAEDTLRTIGKLAGGTVLAPNAAAVSELTFEWDGPPGQPFGFNPVQALRSKGFKVQALYCSPMVSEGTNYFLVAAPGKRPGFLAVYAFDAPLAISIASWSIRYRLDGHIPSLAEVQADEDTEATTDCSTETFGPVEQISHAQAETFVRSRTSATQGSR
ncbi:MULTISPECIES: hypothetical protein [Sphingomonas]|uniref:Uncharacterized protein n=1 Tax=Sphingomonas molluscorum TaxID=418184 RepID=A0ABU8PZT4_9SPHN|nr:hypothetical protein [Sphingomonas sp. JUb134]MBM7404478.1 hypothetical protein [Sphingomonas sp. JUb134]